ncbi:hypothetical protein CSUI_005431 [Cystoisospora suis]|uniref:Uncharacterized protein n=1 Tax=Cystoisospora suis TaxID=483139 RepID=A0A2C6KJQ2_9APIC|nr:hypothetical protein CSUI_005431 [Cystoisospora suis]
MIDFIERRDERRRRIQSARDAAAAAGEERGEEIQDHTYGAVNRRSSMSSTPSSSSTSSAFYFSSSSAEDVSSYRSQAATLRAEAAEARDKAQCLRSGSQKSLLLSLAVSKENRAQALVAAADVAEQEAREVAEAQRRREDRGGRQPQQQCAGQRMRPINDEEEENRQLKRNSYNPIPCSSQDDVLDSSRETAGEWTRTRRDGEEGGERQVYEQGRQYYPSDNPSWEMHSNRSSRQGHEEARDEHRPLCSPASSTSSGRELRSPLESQRDRPSYSREEEEEQSRTENASSTGESQTDSPTPFDPPWVRHARLLRREAAEQRDRAQCVRGTKQRALLLVAQKKEKEADELLQYRGLVPSDTTDTGGQQSSTVFLGRTSNNQDKVSMRPVSSPPFPPPVPNSSSSSSTSLAAFSAFNAAWASSQQAVAAAAGMQATGSSFPPRSYSASSSGGASACYSTRPSTSRQSSSFTCALGPAVPFPEPSAGHMSMGEENTVEDKRLMKIRELQREAAAMRDKAALVRGSKQRALILTAELREREAEKLLNMRKEEEEQTGEEEKKPLGSEHCFEPPQDFVPGGGRGRGLEGGEQEERDVERWRYSTKGEEGRGFPEYQSSAITGACRHGEPLNFLPPLSPPFVSIPPPLPSSSSCIPPGDPSSWQQQPPQPLHQEAPQVVVSPVLAEVQRLRQEASVLRDKASCCSGAKARQLRSMAEMKEHRAEALLLPPSSPDPQEGSVRGGVGVEVKKEIHSGIEPSHHYMEAPYSRDLFLESGDGTGDGRSSFQTTYKRESEGANTDSFSSPLPPSSYERPRDRDQNSGYNELAVGSTVSGLKPPASPKGRRISVEEKNISLGERVTSRTGGCTDTPSREPDGSGSHSLDDDEDSAYSGIPEWQRYRQLMQEVRSNREKANCVGGGRQRQLLAIAAAKERQAEELKKKAMEIHSLSSINTNTPTPTTTGLAQTKVTVAPTSQYPHHHEHPLGGGIPEDRGKRESSSLPPPVNSRPKTSDEPSFVSSLDYEEETVVVPQEKVSEGMSSRQLHRNFGLMDEGQQQQEHVCDFTRHFEAVSPPPPLPENLPLKNYPLERRDSSTITTTTLPQLVSDRQYHLERKGRDFPEDREGDPADPVFIAQKGDHQQPPPCTVSLPPPRLTRFSTQEEEEDDEDEQRGHSSHDLKKQLVDTRTVNDSRRSGGLENLSLNMAPYSRTTTPTAASMSIKRTITTSSSGCPPPSDMAVRPPYLVGPGGEDGVGSGREIEPSQQEHQERYGIQGLNSGGMRESLHHPIALEELRRHQDALQRQLKLVEEQLLLHTQREAHEGQQRRSKEVMPPGIKGDSHLAARGTGDFSSLVEERTTKVELPQ